MLVSTATCVSSIIVCLCEYNMSVSLYIKNRLTQYSHHNYY